MCNETIIDTFNCPAFSMCRVMVSFLRQFLRLWWLVSASVSPSVQGISSLRAVMRLLVGWHSSSNTSSSNRSIVAETRLSVPLCWTRTGTYLGQWCKHNDSNWKKGFCTGLLSSPYVDGYEHVQQDYRVWYLQCVSNGDTTVSHRAITCPKSVDIIVILIGYT